MKTTKNNIESIYPLSPMQQGMLFHTLYTPESAMYFEQFTYHLQGKLNVTAFQKAWQQVAERHSVLRTAIVWEKLDEPLQVVCRQVEMPWSLHDWQDLAPAEQAIRLENFLGADRKQGFELSTAPLMRLALIHVTENEYWFIWSFHHLLLDGWSGAIIWSELFTLYNALCKGKEAQLPLCRPYLDYIAWLQQQDLTKAETFWRQTLKGFTAPTPLGVNKSVSDNAAQPSVYSQKQIKLSKSTTLALQTFVRQHQLTLNTLIQGVWALLLSRYSGEEDVVFGTTVSGRPAALAGVETMVGLFINTLPVRVQATLGEMLIPWLQALQRQHLEVRQYDHTPLVQIQGWSDVPRGLPLFESLLVFENYPTYTSTSNQDEHLLIQSIHAYERTN